MKTILGPFLHWLRQLLLIAVIPGLFLMPKTLSAKEDQDTTLVSENRDTTPIAGTNIIAFEADSIEYENELGSEIITAIGNVLLSSEDQSVRADTITWHRRSQTIIANGNVRLVDESGNQLFTERLELTERFESGAIDELLLSLRAGGRLAAQGGIRERNGDVILSQAAYTACPVTTLEGCDKTPSWRITANRIIYDPKDNTVSFDGAVLELFGTRMLPMPGLSFRTDGNAISGFLVPDLRVSESNGVEISGSYYWRIANDRDLTVGGRFFTEATPLISTEWRHLTSGGAYQISAYATHSRRISSFTGSPTTERDLRGYIFANGRFQITPKWSVTGSLRRASDRTFLRRYDISRDDRLRSNYNIERISENSYLSIAGWATQTLRLEAPQGQVPMALPAIDYRHRFSDVFGGGSIQLQANTLSLVRDQGQDTQRAFASARWDLKKLTSLGQIVTFSALARGDVYHSAENGLTTTEIYRGNSGWQGRTIGIGAIDVEWPFVGNALGGTQVFKPRVQLVASPAIKNLEIPNEDSRAIDLEDSNLFALSRFPGYDRVEDGIRLSYGVDWELNRPGWRVKTSVGQSYRFDSQRAILPDGTGLSDRVSDFVGRTEVRFKDTVKLTHRFRIDKDNFAVRRNEFDATIGNSQNYIELGYLRLDRDIEDFEDLQDREELRAAARIAFARYWSIFGSGVFNLTDRNEDPSFISDGFEPIRTRLGIAYRDECLEFGLTWRRDYVTAGDAERGDTFQLTFALRNLGLS